MLKSTLSLIILSIFVGTGAWLVFLWAARKGEFDDTEGPKYRMLDDDPPPQRSNGRQNSPDEESNHD